MFYGLKKLESDTEWRWNDSFLMKFKKLGKQMRCEGEDEEDLRGKMWRNIIFEGLLLIFGEFLMGIN